MKRTSIAQRTSRAGLWPVRTVLSLVLFALGALSLLSSSLMGCAGKGSSTPTPTKTPTPPSATPSPTSVAFSQTPTRVASTDRPAEGAQSSSSQPTPTCTATCTATPTPQAKASSPRVVLPHVGEAEDVETMRNLLDAQASPNEAHSEGSADPGLAQAGTPASIAGTSEGAAGSFSDINPLTGLRVDGAKLNRRPLGVKIPNFPFEARPQSGLSRADVVIEHEAEAYLTRFTAIFLGNDAGLLGPVRSLRLPDSELMSIFKATLVASGGHPAVKIRITEGKAWAAGYKRIICPEAPFLGDGGATYRVAKEGRRYELTLYSDTPSLWNVCTLRGVNGRQDYGNMWVFDESPPAGGRAATHLKVVYKADYSEAEYRYDGASHTYKRFDMGQPLVDELTGQQIAPANVLVLYVNHVNSDILADTHDPEHPWYAVSIQLWGEGSGRLLRDGQVYDIRWARENAQQESDRLIILDGQGQQVPFRPGPTWIQLVRPDANVQID